MKLIIALIAVFFPMISFSQSLKRLKLTKEDVQNTVKWRYEYNRDDSFYNVTLLLFQNGEYKYSQSNFSQYLYSDGKWEIENKVLLLNSTISRNDVPILISYTNGTSDVVNGFKFGVVKNKKGVYLTDAFVNVNSDSIRCLPMAASCVGIYDRIDSIRLKFENGLTSKWTAIENREGEYIIIEVNTELKISSYTSFDKLNYLIDGKMLIPHGGSRCPGFTTQ